jgi:hypothetical protein
MNVTFALDELHLTSVKGIIQLRPNFSYLDKADKAKAFETGMRVAYDYYVCGIPEYIKL